jgi:hypothetical protein
MTQIPINIADPMKDLQQVIAALNANLAQADYGILFRVQPLPQPGRGCRERFVLWHSYVGGMPISSSEVAINIGGQIAAIHPKFRWEWDAVDGREE